MILEIRDDFELDNWRSFRNYMFALTDYHLKRHGADNMPCHLVLFGNEQAGYSYDRSEREVVYTAWDNVVGSFDPDAYDVTTFIVYFAKEIGDHPNAREEAYDAFFKAAKKWSLMEHSTFVAVGHIAQRTQDMSGWTVPHYHVMYVRKRGEFNVMQDFITHEIANKSQYSWIDIERVG